MEAQLAQFINRGMNQDISVSKATNEFAFKNYNIRITAVNDNTLLSITNEKLPSEVGVSIIKKSLIPNQIHRENIMLYSEYDVKSDIKIRVHYTTVGENPVEEYADYRFEKGTSRLQISTRNRIINSIEVIYPTSDSVYKYYTTDEEVPSSLEVIYDSIPGTYLGHSIVNDTLVLFTTGDKDRIIKLDYVNDIFEGEILYEGNLGFNADYPIETLPLYEAESIRKVYWVDGKNPNRVINIDGDIGIENDYQFDFNPKLNIYPSLFVEKQYKGTGLFPSGVIQYFITYYNKFGTETGIVKASDLHYISPYNIGESPEGTVTCSFKLILEDIDVAYDYLKVYSMLRTSLNGTPVVKVVKEIPISGISNMTIIDNNVEGYVIDPTSLLFLGGDSFISSTLTQKDNTLFLGSIKIEDSIIEDELKESLENNIIEDTSTSIRCHTGLAFTTKEISISADSDFQLNNSSNEISTFKNGEFYRFAIQFQKSNGIWSNPVFLGDLECNIFPNKESHCLVVPTISFEMPDSTKALLTQLNYSNYRLLMAETDISKRRILAQGVVTPTVFNHADRVNNSGPYSIASWIMRPRNGNANFEHMGGLGNISVVDENDERKYYNLTTCEIQNSIEAYPLGEFSEGSDLINNYYVDSSIVDFYSPEIEENEAVFSGANLEFRIIGLIKIDKSESDITLETSTRGINKDAGLVKNTVVHGNRVSSSDEESTVNDSFLRRAVYSDAAFNESGKLPDATAFVNSSAKYYLYLWNKEDSIIGQTAESIDANDKPFDISHSDLKHKIIANKRTSNSPLYFSDASNPIFSYPIKPIVFNSDVVESKVLPLSSSKSVIYQGNYESIIPTRTEVGDNDDFSYRVFFSDARVTVGISPRPGGIGSSSGIPIDRTSHTYTDLKQYSPVSIKYKTTAHLTFALKNIINDKQYMLLPYLSSNEELHFFDELTGLNSMYPSEYFGEDKSTVYPWLDEGESYGQDVIGGINTGEEPYLFIGEIYRRFSNIKDIYGGYDEGSLKNINWVPISESCNINEKVTKTGGDTYYQRWDCLSTYPFTEEDKNSVVDITSFMVETHKNIDGRYDKNKEIDNIINVRKTNFNKVNSVYSQLNNYFSYNIIDSKFNNPNYQNQVAFSMSKSLMEDIDTWCSINLSSAINLDGRYGKITKLTNFNNTIIALQEKALSTVDFNNRTALSTENGVPIEIANSGKVNGYSILASEVGCQNKEAVCNASSGLYFVDNLNNTLYSFNREGLSDVSSNGMSMWFKKNLKGNEKLFYDSLTKDVYITNTSNCLTYNEALQSFTSFMEYSNINTLFNLKGKSFILDKTSNGLIIPMKMFSGKYANDYYMQYKINPEPLVDKTFTNIEYIADCFKAEDSIDGVYSSIIKDTYNILPFTGLTVWTEYQKGSVSLDDVRFRFPNIEKKFRVWRTDIPRDDSNQRDRIRNPWMYLRLSKSEEPQDIKMVFHNLLVKYYK